MTKKTKRKIGKISIVTLTFATSLAAAYFVTPNKVRQVVLNKGINNEVEDNQTSSHFMDFVARLTQDIGLEESEEVRDHYGVHAVLDDLNLSFKTSDTGADNNISLNGDLDFTMRGLQNINFNLFADANYNSRNIPLEVGYINSTAYLGIKDLRMKFGSTTINELIGDEEQGIPGLFYQYFMASKEEGGINFNVPQFFEEKYNSLLSILYGSLDLENMTSSFKMGEIGEDESGIGLSVKENETNEGYDFLLDLTINKEEESTKEITSTPLKITLKTDKDLALNKVELTKVEIANFKATGSINIEFVKDYVVYAPDNENFRNFDANRQYIEVINYKGWLQKLAHLLDEDNQKFGIDFSFNLDSKNSNSLNEIGEINGSINADFSQLIDLSNYKVRNAHKNALSPTIENIKNKASLGIDLKMLGQNSQEYGNLSIDYVDGQGFLKLNEYLDEHDALKSVLKAKVETETINWLVDELPDMFASLGDENNDTTTSALSSLFSFITDSELVRGVKTGDYSLILDLIKDLRNDEDKIELALDLSSLGLGDEAEVNLLLDSRTGESNKVLNIDIENITLGSLVLNASINSDDFKGIDVGDEDSYDSLSFLPSVFDQVYGILDTKQAGFSIEGSVLDNDNLGLRLSGNGQFDYGTRYGFGDLTIDQYKYKNKGVWYSHKIALDVDDTNTDRNLNNAFFVYGDTQGEDNIKGKVTVQSVLDIVGVVKTFVGEVKDEPKFTKFVEPIMKMMSAGQLGDIINSKDYFKFLKNDLLKSVSRTDSKIDIIIGGALFEMDGDINIRVNFTEEDKIDSLEIINLGLSGKKLNLNIQLKEFDNQKQSKINRTDSFIDLSTISLLLKFGLNTTKNDYYHLNADIGIHSKHGVIDMDFSAEVFIVIKNEYVKIYGILPDLKITSVAQDYAPLVTSYMKSEFTFETYSDDDINKENGVGGYFDIKTTKKSWGVVSVKHYRATSAEFIKDENLMTYLLNDLLFIRDLTTDAIGAISLNSNNEEKEAGNFTNALTDTGFNYNEASNKWTIGLNLNELIGIDALKTIEATIYGSEYENLKKLDVKLNIQALFVSLDVNATITLDDPNPSIKDWSDDIEAKFQAIRSVNFSTNEMNDPSVYLSK